MRSPRSAVLAAGVLLATAQVVAAAAPPASRDPWTVSWSTSQHVAGAAMTDQSARMIVRLTQGGDALRVRIGNTLGTTPLILPSVTVGLRKSGAELAPGTVRALTFKGRSSATIPAGGYLVSDPVALRTSPQQDLAVSMFVKGTAVPSAHGAAFQTSYLTPAGAGDRTRDATATVYSGTTTQFLMVDAVDVRNPDVTGAIVVVGGSVTDGTGSDKSGVLGTGPAPPPNSRWSDVLARRILKELPARGQLAVAQAGIAANTAARECAQVDTGPYGNVQGRLERDVLSLTNVRFLIIYAGTNDLGLGTGCTAEQIIAAFRDITRRAQAQGIRVIIATVTPRAIYTPLQNQERHDVNLWITKWNRCGGECDGMANFDAAISWPAFPNAIDPQYDSGDDIHPNAQGYALLGQTVDLRMFRR